MLLKAYYAGIICQGLPGGPRGGIAAGCVGLHSPCTGGSSGMCLVTAYTCRRYQARGGGSGGSETGQGASQTRVG